MNRLIKVINDAIVTTTKEMKKSTQDGFAEVTMNLDSIYDVFLKRAPKSATVKDFTSINTEPQVRNVQIPSTPIDAGREDLNTSLHQL